MVRSAASRCCPFGLLTFVVGTLLVANAWGVVDAKLAVTSAAARRSGLRRGTRRGERGRGAATPRRRRSPATAATPTDDPRDPPRRRRPFARCTRVTVTVHHPVPAIRLPFIGGYGHAFDVVASQSEVVDPYRSGLPGEATC